MLKRGLYVFAGIVGVVLVETGVLSPVEWTSAIFRVSPLSAAFLILVVTVAGALSYLGYMLRNNRA